MALTDHSTPPNQTKPSLGVKKDFAETSRRDFFAILRGTSRSPCPMKLPKAQHHEPTTTTGQQQSSRAAFLPYTDEMKPHAASGGEGYSRGPHDEPVATANHFGRG